MIKSRKVRNPRGFSLIEVVVAVVIFSVVLIALARIAFQSGRFAIRTGTRSIATNLANNTLERLQQTPYLLLEETPSHLFPNPKICDCDQVDWTRLPGESIRSGEHTYTLQTCINKVDGPKGRAYCPEEAEDKGLKFVRVRASWIAEKDEQDIKTGVLIKEPDVRDENTPQTAVFKLRLCRQIESATRSDELCSPVSTDMSGASVGVFNETFHTYDQPLTLGKDTVEIKVPAPGAYAIHAHKYGFFPVHLENQRVLAGETKNLTLPLKSWTFYGSRFGGELYVADHLIISKVVAQATAFNECFDTTRAICPDATEVLEIYNPTDRPFPLGQLLVAFYSAASSTKGPSTTLIGFQRDSSVSQIRNGLDAIEPRSYLLIMGVNDSAHPAENPWRIQPDIWYQAGLKGKDLIRYKEGGGIRLLVNQISVDAVRWKGLETETTPQDESLGPWEGEPLPGSYLQPARCAAGAHP